MLKAPEFTELDDFLSENREGGTVKALNLGFVEEELEKRQWEMELPFALFDSKIAFHVKFCVNLVLPALHSVAKSKENAESRYLLLDTRIGLPLDSRLIRVIFSS